MLPVMKPFFADEELGKKYDDHKLRTDKQRWRIRHCRAPRPRRLLLVVVAAYILYLLFQNVYNIFAPTAERYSHNTAQDRQKESQWLIPMPAPSVISHNAPPPRDESMAASKGDFYYDEEINFPNLQKTLLHHKAPLNRHAVSRAVVFAASSLKSVSDILPLACQMARKSVNSVHLVLMGRDNVSIGGIQYVNGVCDDECPIHWHDSRPDYAQWSTDARMKSAVIAGLCHIESYIRPQVIITQRESLEDTFFLTGMRQRMRDSNVPGIVLPSPSSNLMWISTLDSTALTAWNDLNIEILLQAPPQSSGSFIRLIKSLESAEYLGLPPTLTIELPPRTNPQLLHFLETMQWPPRMSGKITLRRRVLQENMSPAESAIKTVESFYPRNPNTSHLLVLSPQVELAPSFYHYLLYASLRYKQSLRGKHLPKLLGISLELPSSNPIGNEPFTPPLQEAADRGTERESSLPHFLWQAPNSNAALYFGDKWAEFHSFLSKRLTVREVNDGVAPHDKLVSRKYPAFMEFLLEFIRVKGYYMLYPSFSAGAYALATVHKELYQVPEEFFQDVSSRTVKTPDDSVTEVSEPVTVDSLQKTGSSEAPLSQKSTIISLLNQFGTDLPDIDSLPLLSYRRDRLSRDLHGHDTEEYATKFRIRFGGCYNQIGYDEDSSGLFCMND